MDNIYDRSLPGNQYKEEELTQEHLKVPESPKEATPEPEMSNQDKQQAKLDIDTLLVSHAPEIKKAISELKPIEKIIA